MTPRPERSILLTVLTYMNIRSIPIVAGCFAALGLIAVVALNPHIPTPAQLAPEETALLAEWVKVGDALAVQRMIEHGACVEAVSDDGTTALMVASAEGYLDVARVLLLHNAKVNARNHDGETPLHFAVRDNRPEIVALLLEHGATVDAINANGVTPLMIAAWSGFDTLVERLLAAGADSELTDDEGSKAATYARDVQDDAAREKILKLLGA